MTRLERWYRVLMFAYPADFESNREEEMITTLLALTKPGQQRPTVRDAIDLVANGLRMRVELRPSDERVTGLKWAGAASLWMTAVIATLVPTIHLTRRWSNSRPTGFVPLWSAIAVITMVMVLQPRWATWARRTGLVVLLATITLGPVTMMAQRTLLLTLAWFFTLASYSVRAIGRRRGAVIVAFGVFAGGFAAQRLVSALHTQSSRPWPRHAMYLRETVPFLGEWFQWWWIVLGVACLLAALRIPGLGLTYALLAVPLFGSMLMLTSTFDTRLLDHREVSDKTVFLTGLLVVIGLSIGLSKPRRRQVPSRV